MNAAKPNLSESTASEIKRASLRWLSTQHIPLADQEDLFQTAMSKMLAHLDELKEQEKLVPWFIQILRNTVSDHLRKKSSTKHALEKLAHDPTENTEPELETHLCQCFEKSLTELTEDDQIILRKHYMEGVSFDNLAKELHKTPQALRTRATRAKHHVRELLQKSCGIKSFNDLSDCCD